MKYFENQSTKKQERKKKYFTGSEHIDNQCQYQGFLDRKDFYWQDKDCVCSRAELLFLSRSDWILSHWLASGSDRE